MGPGSWRRWRGRSMIAQCKGLSLNWSRSEAAFDRDELLVPDVELGAASRGYAVTSACWGRPSCSGQPSKPRGSGPRSRSPPTCTAWGRSSQAARGPAAVQVRVGDGNRGAGARTRADPPSRVRPGVPEVFLTGGAGPAVAGLLGRRACHVPHLTLAGIALASIEP